MLKFVNIPKNSPEKSSSDIRNFIQNNDARVKNMVNKNIFNYIIKEKLYQ